MLSSSTTDRPRTATDSAFPLADFEEIKEPQGSNESKVVKMIEISPQFAELKPARTAFASPVAVPKGALAQIQEGMTRMVAKAGKLTAKMRQFDKSDDKK